MPSGQFTLPQPTDQPETITETALQLFGQIWTGEQAVRLIGHESLASGAIELAFLVYSTPYSPVARDRAFVVTNRYPNFFTRR
jgi:hypothetical protein